MLPSIRAGTPKASSTLRAEVAYSPGLLVAELDELGAREIDTSGLRVSTAAHLVEVARSLGVAAVLGCSQEDLFSLVGGAGDPGTLVAVDGDSGRVVVDVHRGK